MSDSQIIVGLKLREYSTSKITHEVKVLYGDARTLYIREYKDNDMYEAEVLIIPLSIPTIVIETHTDKADLLETIKLHIFTSIGWIETYVK